MSKDTFYSIAPLNWLLRCIAFSNIYRKGTQLAESGSIAKCAVYIVTIGLVNISCLYYKVLKLYGNLEVGIVRFSDAIEMVYWVSYIEYIIDLFFVFKYGRVMLLKYFKAFDYIDSILGISCYDTIRRTVIVTVIFSVGVSSFVFVFDYVCWILAEGWVTTTIGSVYYLYFLLSMFTILDVISHVVQVEYRLNNIRHLLQGSKTIKTSHMIVSFIENSNTKISVGAHESKSLNTLKTLSNTKYLETAWFNRCYLLLLEQVDYINTSYGFRVLVYCVNLIHYMINLLNLAIRVFNGRLQPTYATEVVTVLTSLSSTMRAFHYSVMMMLLTYRCEQVYKQSEKLLEMIDELLTRKNNYNLKADCLEFRNLVITRPIKFHAAKFFTIDYTVLVSLSSAVVTYTIILLQSMQ